MQTSRAGPREKLARALPPEAIAELPVDDLAASFQAAVVDVLVEKTRRAAAEYRVAEVLLAGGVAANELLRERIRQDVGSLVRCPPVYLCTDNAAMVASAGFFRLRSGVRAQWDLDVIPSMEIP
jgi:N6-L-threonylcarbamoyladenine synthase